MSPCVFVQNSKYSYSLDSTKTSTDPDPSSSNPKSSLFGSDFTNLFGNSGAAPDKSLSFDSIGFENFEKKLEETKKTEKVTP
eukprot:500901-Amorphochlora_amoeboformis.AAC.1